MSKGATALVPLPLVPPSPTTGVAVVTGPVPVPDEAAATPQIVTFGCRLNSYESEVIRGHIRAVGAANTVVVNTCAVTGEAERQVRQAIRRLRREQPAARIVVTGCAAQIDPAGYAAMPEVDAVLGNQEKLHATHFEPFAAAKVVATPTSVHVADIQRPVAETALPPLVTGLEGRSRAFVQVQQGCDHRCTFCIVPAGRGPSRSRAVNEVVREVRGLVAAGYREVVLSGVDIASYGRDQSGQPSLGRLAAAVLAEVPDLPRLRLSSLDPAAVDATLWTLIANESRLMPHLHLSLQAGDDLILRRMRRRHRRAEVLELCARARALRPEMTFGADLIAGFPTEDEAMFANTLALVDEAALTWLHVFPYSARPGTPAARMSPVPGAVRKERAARLRAAGVAASTRHLAASVRQCAQMQVPVLIERADRGRCANFTPVQLNRTCVAGELVAVWVDDHTDSHLLGRVIETGAGAGGRG